MELLLTDSPLCGKLSEEGGLILPHVKPAEVWQKVSKALDGREKIPALVSALGNECSSVVKWKGKEGVTTVPRCLMAVTWRQIWLSLHASVNAY